MKLAAFICIILILQSCASPQNSNQFDGEKVDREVRIMFQQYHEDIAKGGLQAEFKYLDQSENFFWVPPGYNSALSYDSVRQILIENDKAFTDFDFQWDNLRIIPLNDELANYTGIVVGQITDTTGVVYQVSIIESGTVIKRADGWKLLCGQSANAVVPSEKNN